MRCIVQRLVDKQIDGFKSVHRRFEKISKLVSFIDDICILFIHSFFGLYFKSTGFSKNSKLAPEGILIDVASLVALGVDCRVFSKRSSAQQCPFVDADSLRRVFDFVDRVYERVVVASSLLFEIQPFGNSVNRFGNPVLSLSPNCVLHLCIAPKRSPAASASKWEIQNVSNV